MTDSSTESQPGTCGTSGCDRLVPEGAEYCGPCKILFGSYAELVSHNDVHEWRPEDQSGRPDAPETPNDAGDDDDPPKEAAPKRPKPPRAAPRPARRRPSTPRSTGTSEASSASS